MVPPLVYEWHRRVPVWQMVWFDILGYPSPNNQTPASKNLSLNGPHVRWRFGKL